MQWILISFLLSSSAYSKSITKLKVCKEDCKCNAPMLTAKEKFVFTPDLKKEEVLQCNLNIESINAIARCILKVGAVAPACSAPLVPELPLPQNDCENIKFEFDYPPTYAVGDKAPSNCGYKWKGFNSKEYERVLANFLETDKISCTQSMCTSATFLALAKKAKTLYENKMISRQKYLELTNPKGVAYKLLNNNAEPNELVEHFGLGTGHIIYPDESRDKKWKVPQAGDLTQIWRKNRSGHSVVFKGFIDRNNDGKNDYICYWSSQTRTNGYGNVCEELSTVDKILVGHFDV